MYDAPLRRAALGLLADGKSISAVARELGVSRAAVRSWRELASADPQRRGHCPRCDEVPFPLGAYAALLGYYLGDGCVSRMRRSFSLRISCDVAYPGIVDDVTAVMVAVHPDGRAFHVRAPGVIVVQGHWKHWPCLFPQHGPGRKHERPIVLEDWQRTVVAAHPAPFLRGLFHSDGSRVRNWATRVVAGERKRYDYPRWQFTNVSADIRELCCWALDLVDVPWRQSNHQTISVSSRAAVARLDELVGPKR